jgi:hypothetical protein
MFLRIVDKRVLDYMALHLSEDIILSRILTLLRKAPEPLSNRAIAPF